MEELPVRTAAVMLLGPDMVLHPKDTVRLAATEAAATSKCNRKQRHRLRAAALEARQLLVWEELPSVSALVWWVVCWWKMRLITSRIKDMSKATVSYYSPLVWPL
jgi:hypothetical protein